jgi:SAM-dependent methyltransferase
MLWGDRARWGLTPDVQDPHWHEWQKTYVSFYLANQREGIGTAVNDAGYSVMSKLDLTGKSVLEVGAGDIRHLQHWQGRPGKYLLADISEDMMQFAKTRLASQGIQYEILLLHREQPLPLQDASVDIIVSFYSLEHIYPLEPYLDEMLRVLKPGGILIGAVPAEGGLAWGLGRLLTSRRWFKNNTSIDPDKIICWEHPNFADEILECLDSKLTRRRVHYWPLPWLPFLDTNLVIRFEYRKA